MPLDPTSNKSKNAIQVWIDDAKLWTSFKNGELLAYEHIFNTYAKWLYNYGRNLGGDHEMVKDLLQDFYANLWHKRSKLASVEQIKPYLFKSFRRLVIKELERRKRKSNYRQEDSFQVSIETQLINEQSTQEQNMKLQEAISNLSERQREALYLKFYENLSYEEISLAMKINLNTLYNTISAAIRNLKSQILPDVILLLILQYLL